MPDAMTLSGKEVAGIPEDVIIGKVEGEWPLYIFGDKAHAVYWHEEQSKKNKRPRLYLAQLVNLQETEYVPPGSADLKVKESDAQAGT